MMITAIAWIVFVFTLAQLVVAVVNIIWLERMRHAEEHNALVSILIPARNEEANIGNIIADILEQGYSNFELIVCDDQSDDGTAAVVEDFIAADPRVRLIMKDHLPEGWLGKNHACHVLSEAAAGNYYLFLDADVRIKGDIIPQAIAHAREHKLSLISIFPRQIMISAGEWITVPVMNYILLTLLPLILVRMSPRPSLSAANGQFMFFDAAEYQEQEPHKALKANRVEDIAIARMYKERALNISCQTGDARVSCRMYASFGEALAGFSRNVLDFFGGSAVPAIIFWLITSLGFIAVIAAFSLPMIIVWLAAYILTRVFVSLHSRQHVFKNIILLIPQQLSMGLFIFNAIFRSKAGRHKWKGRKI